MKHVDRRVSLTVPLHRELARGPLSGILTPGAELDAFARASTGARGRATRGRLLHRPGPRAARFT
ncbi:MAG: hypothetical protein M3Z95_03585 [Actinomycetota bacterium]|nr:hypothetical protein [Actinomycetota bacterium]